MTGKFTDGTGKTFVFTGKTKNACFKAAFANMVYAPCKVEWEEDAPCKA